MAGYYKKLNNNNQTSTKESFGMEKYKQYDVLLHIYTQIY